MSLFYTDKTTIKSWVEYPQSLFTPISHTDCLHVFACGVHLGSFGGTETDYYVFICAADRSLFGMGLKINSPPKQLVIKGFWVKM